MDNINERVANKLMVDYCNDPNCITNCPCEEKLKDYCGDIRAAWEIVEYCRKQGRTIALDSDEEHFRFFISNPDRPDDFAFADTAPMAICLAFLKLKEGERD